MKIIELIQIDFDTDENRDPTSIKSHGLFMDDGVLTAHGKMHAYLKTLPKIKPYLGWDGNIYPRFEVRTNEVR